MHMEWRVQYYPARSAPTRSGDFCLTRSDLDKFADERAVYVAHQLSNLGSTHSYYECTFLLTSYHLRIIIIIDCKRNCKNLNSDVGTTQSVPAPRRGVTEPYKNWASSIGISG